MPELGQGAARRSGRRAVNQYPHQFFDLSQAQLPPTVKELFRWCLFFYSAHSEVKSVVDKKVAYVLQDLVFQAKGPRSEQIWKDLFNETLKFRTVMKKLLIDREIYGNAFASIHYPHQRYLECPSCGTKTIDKRVNWKYSGFTFKGACPKCGRKEVEFTPHDKPIKNRTRLRILRWYPQHMEIRYNHFTGRSQYIYRIPKWLRTRLMDPTRNRIHVEETPLVFLEAVKEQKNIEFHPNNLYHFKNEGVSSEDESWGMPPLFAVFKDLWLYQTYKRGQESVAVEHILPLTVLSPQPPGGTQASPHMNFDLRMWSRETDAMIRRWRRDANAIFTMPFPFTVQNIRGDAQALNLDSSIAQVRSSIMAGLGVPASFIDGGLNFSGASVTLRTVENVFLGMIAEQEAFIQWTIDRIRRWDDMPPIKITLANFKLADDAQQKQIILTLRQTNTVDDQTVIEQLGLDYEEIQKRRKLEVQQRIQELTAMQIAQAEIQARTTIMMAEAQAKAQKIQQKILTGDNPSPEEEKEKAMQGAAQSTGVRPDNAQSAGTAAPGSQTDPIVLSAMSEHFMKTVSPEDRERELQMLRRTNPAMEAVYRQHMAKQDLQHRLTMQEMDKQHAQGRQEEMAALAGNGRR